MLIRRAAVGLVLLPAVVGWSTFVPAFRSHGVSSRAAAVATAPARTLSVSGSVGKLRCSLYEDQEKIVVARGVKEESLMPPPTPLVAAKRGSAAGAGGGGFGAASTSKKGISKQHQTEAKLLAKDLRREGVVRIDDVLSHETADQLLAYVKELRTQSTDDVESGRLASLQRFADVLLKTNRCDLTLPLEKEPLAALSEVVLGHKGVMGHLIESMLGKQAVLYELSTLISDPGSQRQYVHPDTPYGGAGGAGESEPVLFTTFVALQDVTLDMGPTLFLPRTHTDAAHAQFRDQKAGKDVLLQTTPSVCGLLPKGSAAIFDSRLLHAGSANKSPDLSRALFYFTFKNPKLANAGNPGSIRPELVGKLTLQDLQKELNLLEDKGSSPNLELLASTMR